MIPEQKEAFLSKEGTTPVDTKGSIQQAFGLETTPSQEVAQLEDSVLPLENQDTFVFKEEFLSKEGSTPTDTKGSIQQAFGLETIQNLTSQDGSRIDNTVSSLENQDTIIFKENVISKEGATPIHTKDSIQQTFGSERTESLAHQEGLGRNNSVLSVENQGTIILKEKLREKYPTKEDKTPIDSYSVRLEATSNPASQEGPQFENSPPFLENQSTTTLKEECPSKTETSQPDRTTSSRQAVVGTSTHQALARIQCNICGAISMDVLDYTKHLRVHSVSPSKRKRVQDKSSFNLNPCFKCHYHDCTFVGRNKCGLSNHLKVHLKPSSEHSGISGEAKPSKNAEHNESLKHPNSDRIYGSKAGLDQHMNTHSIIIHSAKTVSGKTGKLNANNCNEVGDNSSLECPLCIQVCCSRPSLVRHIKKHHSDLFPSANTCSS